MSENLANLVLTEEDMKTLLNYSVSEEDSQTHRNNYELQVASNNVDVETKFQYAWCLTHSKSTSDIKEASVLLEEIFKEGTEELKRDSLFYLAVAETKLKDYIKAKKYVEAFLSVEPNNVQAEQLKLYIDKMLRKDGVKGMALVGAAALFGGAAAVAIGTLVVGAAVGFALKRKNR